MLLFCWSELQRRINFDIKLENKKDKYEWILLIYYINNENEKILLDEINITKYGMSKCAFDPDLVFIEKISNIILDINNNKLREIKKTDSEISCNDNGSLKKHIFKKKLKEIMLITLQTLKTFGDKSYEFMIPIFLILNHKLKSKINFLIGSEDNHFLISMLLFQMPLIKELYDLGIVLNLKLGFNYYPHEIEEIIKKRKNAKDKNNISKKWVGKTKYKIGIINK